MPNNKEDDNREQVARLAADALIDGRIYHSYAINSVQDSYVRDSSVESGSMSVNAVLPVNTIPSDNCITEGAEVSGRISAVRRFFCLYVTFDFLFTFLLWLVCCAITGKFGTSVIYEIKNYGFKTSSFDIVMVSAIRSVFLLMAYALFRIQHWWMVAITTAGTSAFLIAKVSLFQWDFKNSDNITVFSVILLLCSFVLAWGEAWFLDFRVLPQEQRARELLARTDSERTPLLYNTPFGRHLDYQNGNDSARFYSPIQSHGGSEDEEEGEDGVTFAPRNYMQFSPQDREFKQRGKSILEHAWKLLTSDGWSVEKNINKESIIYSKTLPSGDKIFKLHAVLNVNARILLDELYYKIENISQWNPSILESQILYTVDNHTDVTYQLSAGVGNGIVSSRDFVTLRHWQMKDGSYVLAGASIKHASKPESKKIIRAENGPGAWVMQPIYDQPRKCIFQWLLNTNLKGWIPQYVIDQTMSSVMMEYLQCLRVHIKNLQTTEDVIE